ncbi:MAG: dethiobiotin synthase [Pseudomonadota bacterium]
MTGYFITGTDTDVGKTVASAWAMIHLDAAYWKPTQSGEPYDIDTVKALTEFPEDRFLPSTYVLKQPLSPHEAAKRDGVNIDMNAFELPKTDWPLVVEGAGGLMVPLNKDALVIDLIQQLGLPAILVCRSGLGTINHTLLSLEAMRKRNMDIAGIIINGPITPHNRQALEEYGHVPVIAEIDELKPLNKMTLGAIPPEIDLLGRRQAA